MFEFLFLDLDDTLLDFRKAEAIAAAKTFQAVGLEPTEARITRYSQINKLHWQMLERGELTREQVLVRRFSCLFRELGLDADAAACKESYESFLCAGHYFMDGAEELLAYLFPRYKLYLASNGITRVQTARLASAGIGKYFSGIFLSQDMGANKPSPLYFRRCFARIPGFDPGRAMIVGDSLTSDIKGGRGAGIQTCWYNPRGETPLEGIHPDYEIRHLLDLKTLL